MLSSSVPTRCATRWGEPTKQPSWLARRGVVTGRPNSFSLLHWEALPGQGQERHSKHMMRRKQIEWKKRARRPPRTGDPHRERHEGSDVGQRVVLQKRTGEPMGVTPRFFLSL